MLQRNKNAREMYFCFKYSYASVDPTQMNKLNQRIDSIIWIKITTSQRARRALYEETHQTDLPVRLDDWTIGQDGLLDGPGRFCLFRMRYSNISTSFERKKNFVVVFFCNSPSPGLACDLTSMAWLDY